MFWSFTNLVIQLVAGIVGGHAAAAAAKDHNFGVVGHTVAGALGGGLSVYFFQTIAVTMVTGADTLNEPRFGEQVVLQGLTGLVAGGIAVLLSGIVKHAIDQYSSSKR